MAKQEAARRRSLLSAQQVKEVFGGRSDRTLRRWRDTKGFPEAEKIFGRVFYDEAEVYAWRDRQIAEDAARKAAS